MARLIADTKTMAAVINYHAEKNFAEKFERGIKRQNDRQRVAALVSEGIERSIAADMVRFGLA